VAEQGKAVVKLKAAVDKVAVAEEASSRVWRP
jgi:hypothetical protein